MYARQQQRGFANAASREEGQWVVNSLFGAPLRRAPQQAAELERAAEGAKLMRDAPALWGFANNKYFTHKTPGKNADDYKNLQRSAGAEHHTIADIGTWWGDNNAWYDGWEAHRKDVHQAPRWWDKDFDGYKSYGRDLDRDMPDLTWRNEAATKGQGDGGEAFGEGVAMNDDETYEREPMARTFNDPVKYGPMWNEKSKIPYYGINEKPTDTYPGYTIHETKHKGSKTPEKQPPWCDWILGCEVPYDKEGDLKWNTEPDDPADSRGESYRTDWYRINQFRR